MLRRLARILCVVGSYYYAYLCILISNNVKSVCYRGVTFRVGNSYSITETFITLNLFILYESQLLASYGNGTPHFSNNVYNGLITAY